MNKLTISLLSVASFAIQQPTAPQAHGAYVFTNVADTVTSAAPSGAFTAFRTDPAISRGVVAFEANFSAGGASKGIFNGAGGSLTTIVKTGDVAPRGIFTSFGLRGATISDGKTAFYARYTESPFYYEGIFTSNGGPTTAIAKTGDAAPYGRYTALSPPAIDGDTVAFAASFYRDGDTNGSRGIFNTTGGSTTTVTTVSGEAPFRAYTYLGNPAISSGVTAFFGNFTGTGGFGQGIFSDSGGPTTTIAKTGDRAPTGMLGGFSAPAVSGNTVAFHANYDNCCQGIFTSSGGPLTTIAKKGDTAVYGTFASFGITPAISGGNVAFFGFDTSGRGGLYIASSGGLTKVIRGGDPLFGSTVLSLSIGSFGLDPDGGGKIAFYYELSNGRRGIAIAAPAPALPGDYNGDGTVSVQDYNLWKSSFGSTTNLGADGNGNLTIDAGDYTVWRDNLGRTSAAATLLTAAAAVRVPEPSGLVLLAVFVGLTCIKRSQAMPSCG